MYRAIILSITVAGSLHSAEPIDTIKTLDPNVLKAEQTKEAQQILGRDVRTRIQEMNHRSSAEWATIQTRAEWLAYVQPRIEKLRKSVARFPDAPKSVTVRTTKSIAGEGYRIDNIVYESRPGFWVMGNLYLPEKSHPCAVGFLICHSHHNPKSEGELQDMGVTWAKLGCPVLVIDQLGHGERRTHPFVNAESYPGSFRVGRQDYYFRYNTGLQLAAAGESLSGWMAWDMMRGIDVLQSRGVKQVVLLGSVAGGGDPVAVTAALDDRVTVVGPFNFGGPQPETKFPLPDDAETSFNYAGGGSWESTRNLRNSVRDGFLPWVIVGSVAPRGLIYGHEFAWDGKRDPVWKRFRKLWSLTESERLAFAHGKGGLSGRPPEATHCNNIGPEHRAMIHPTLKKWFDIPVPNPESKERHTSTELLCWTPAIIKELQPQSLNAAIRSHLKRQASPPSDREALRREMDRILGGTAPVPGARLEIVSDTMHDGVQLQRGLLKVEREIVVPFLLLNPKPKEKPPLVFAIAQAGKAKFLSERADAIQALLKQGIAVCIPDLRGCGETRPGDGRGRSSSATSISSSEQMLGGTMVGARLRDLRTLMAQLRNRFDGQRLAIWGESFAPMNPDNRRLDVPHDAEKFPDLAEPLGGLIAMYAAMFEDDVKAITVRGGLNAFETLLDSPFLYLPHDAIIPEVLTVADLPTIAAANRSSSIRLEAMIDARNRLVPLGRLKEQYPNAEVSDSIVSGESLAKWFVERLR